jgi:hypothetical protein
MKSLVRTTVSTLRELEDLLEAWRGNDVVDDDTTLLFNNDGMYEPGLEISLSPITGAIEVAIPNE